LKKPLFFAKKKPKPLLVCPINRNTNERGIIMASQIILLIITGLLYAALH